MIRLTVMLKGRTMQRFDLNQTEVRVGRNPENEVVLDSMAVSRHHCSVTRGSDGRWRVKDLSNNGTFLNGSRLAGEAPIKDGDALGIGHFQLVVRTAAGMSVGPVGVESPELREQRAPLKGYLSRSGRPGDEILIEQDVLQFGSGKDVDLRVDGPPKLALLVRGYGGVQLVNVAPGEVPVLVEGAQLLDRRWLRDGDSLRLGELSLVFHEGSPTGGEQTVQIQLSALKLTPPHGLPEAAPSSPPPPPPPPGNP